MNPSSNDVVDEIVRMYPRLVRICNKERWSNRYSVNTILEFMAFLKTLPNEERQQILCDAQYETDPSSSEVKLFARMVLNSKIDHLDDVDGR